jgi:hypothetical protein
MTILAKPSRFLAPSDAQLNRLISRGYFPSELPPPFTTLKFGMHTGEFAAAWDGQKIIKFWTKPEHYSVPRYGLARRQLSIVNPVNQLYVSHLISSNWQPIQEKLNRSNKAKRRNPRILWPLCKNGFCPILPTNLHSRDSMVDHWQNLRKRQSPRCCF